MNFYKIENEFNNLRFINKMRFIILFIIFGIINGFRPTPNIQSDYLNQLQSDTQRRIRQMRSEETKFNVLKQKIKRKDMDDFGPEITDSAVPSDFNWEQIEKIQKETFTNMYKRNIRQMKRKNKNFHLKRPDGKIIGTKDLDDL